VAVIKESYLQVNENIQLIINAVPGMSL